MNKKLIAGTVIMIFLLSAISASAATWSGIAKDTVEKIKTGFEETTKEGAGALTWYDQHTQLIDFTVFFIMFLSIAYLGLRQWLKDEKTAGAVKGLTIAIAAALSLATLKAGVSVTFFIPFVKNALFFITYLVVFLVLANLTKSTKEEGGKKIEIKHLFLNLVLAFVITWVMFNFAGLVGKEKVLPWEDNDEARLSKLQYELDAINSEIAAFEAKMALEGYPDRAALQTAIENIRDNTDKESKTKKKKLQGWLNDWDRLYKGGWQLSLNARKKGKYEIEAEIAKLKAKMEGKEIGAGTQPGTTGSTQAGQATTPEVELRWENADGKIRLICTVTKESTIIKGKGTVRYRYNFQSDHMKMFWKETKEKSASIIVERDQGDSWICTANPFVDGPAGQGGTATARITLPEEIKETDIFANEDLIIKVLEDLTDKKVQTQQPTQTSTETSTSQNPIPPPRQEDYEFIKRPQ